MTILAWWIARSDLQIQQLRVLSSLARAQLFVW